MMTTHHACCSLLMPALLTVFGGTIACAQDSHFTVLVRIPKSLIEKHVNQEFRHTMPVKQVILGTHSQGIAICNGSVVCQPETNEKRASVLFCVKGSVESTTCGINGPATIRSKATTTYESKKRVFFDGERFVSLPATIVTQTSVQVTEVGSTLPGLRGRFVTRIAQRRVRDSNAEAQSIVDNRTRIELLRRVDSEIDGKVTVMNQDLTKNIRILHTIISKDDLDTRSQTDFLEVSYRLDGAERTKFLGRVVSPCKEFELWIKSSRSAELERVTFASVVTRLSNSLVGYGFLFR